MWYVIGIILLIIMGMWLFAVIVTALPAVLLTGASAFVTFYLFLRFRNKHLSTHNQLAHLVRPQIDANRIQWRIDEAKLKQASSALAGGIISLALGGTVCLAVTNWLTRNQRFIRIRLSGKYIIPRPSEILAGVAVMDVGTIILIRRSGIVRKYAKKQIGLATAALDRDIKGFEELSQLDKEMRNITAQWAVPFVHDHMDSVRYYLGNNSTEMMTSLGPLNSLIDKNLQEARADKEHLERAFSCYLEALALYDIAAKDMTNTGSVHLLKECESIYNRLFSDGLLGLVGKKDWEAYQSELAQILTDTKKIKEFGERYRDSEGGWKEVNEENAYQTLGIPESATIEQIKTVYKRLATIYHPDSGIVKDESRMKQINVAYEFIQHARGFA